MRNERPTLDDISKPMRCFCYVGDLVILLHIEQELIDAAVLYEEDVQVYDRFIDWERLDAYEEKKQNNYYRRKKSESAYWKETSL